MVIISAEKTDVIATQKYALVDFYADWCGPCKMLAPELTKAEDDIASLGVFGCKINVDDCNDFSIRNKIQYVPTVIFFENGVEKDRFVGPKDKDGILDFVKKNLQ